jgi:hypothetical protein
MRWIDPKLKRCLCSLTITLAGLALATSANAGVVSAPITNGPCLAPSGSYCAVYRPYVSGTFVVDHFALQDGEIVAEGTVQDGSFFQYYPSLFGATFPEGTPLSLPVADLQASCSSGVVTLTLQGSDLPDPTHGIYEPAPAVFFFDVAYQPPGSPIVIAPIAVGLLPATATVTTERGLACSLANLTSIPGARHGEVAVLNALLRSP